MSNQQETLTTADVARAAEQQERRKEQDRFADNAPAPPQMRGMDPDQERTAPLIGEEHIDELRSRWHDLQGSFVDDPRRAVEEADSLVANAIKLIAESFSTERSRLEQDWARGDAVDTETLRNALRRYRSFFHRLLSI